MVNLTQIFIFKIKSEHHLNFKKSKFKDFNLVIAISMANFKLKFLFICGNFSLKKIFDRFN